MSAVEHKCILFISAVSADFSPSPHRIRRIRLGFLTLRTKRKEKLRIMNDDTLRKKKRERNLRGYLSSRVRIPSGVIECDEYSCLFRLQTEVT